MFFSYKAKPQSSVHLLSLLSLPLLALLLYANTISNGFTLDDVVVITKNSYVQQGLSGIPSIFGSDSFEGYYQQDNRATLITGGRYRPLSLFFFALLFEFFGNNPLPFHLFGIFLFAITSLVLFSTLKVLFKDLEKSTPFLSIISTLLFIVHPVHTEVINNVKSADEQLSFLLSTLTLYYVLLSFDRKQYIYSLAAGITFTLACFSKEAALPTLAIIPTAIFLFRNTLVKNIVYTLKVILPILVSSIIYLLVRGVVLDWKFGNPSNVLINNPFLKWNGSDWIPFTFGEWSATNLFSLGYYIKLLLFPYPLTHDYYPRQIGIMNWSDWEVYLSLLIHLALLSVLVLYKRLDNIYRFSILYYLLSISIVSNIFFPIGTNLSERFLYMPSLGFCIALSGIILKIPRKLVKIGFLSFLILLSSFMVMNRNKDWKSNLTLTVADYNTSKNSAKINNSYAAQVLEKAIKNNSPSEKKTQIEQALTLYSKALEINPNYMEALFGRGSAKFISGDMIGAINDYLIVEKLDPAFPNLRTNLALAFREAAKQLLASNDQDRAIDYLKAAQLRFPNDPEINGILTQLQKQKQ